MQPLVRRKGEKICWRGPCGNGEGGLTLLTNKCEDKCNPLHFYD